MYTMFLITKIGTFQITDVYKAFCSGPGNPNVGEDILYATRVTGEKIIVAQTTAGRAVHEKLATLYDEISRVMLGTRFDGSIQPPVVDLAQSKYAWVNTSLVG